MNAFRKIFQTDPNDKIATLLRIALAVVIFPHGVQKMFGWFGGGGFSGTMAFFTQQMGIPTVFALLAILAEFAGALLLLTGVFTRIGAFGIMVNMAVAVLLVHLPHGFFMNWTGTQTGEGFEFHILALAISLAIVIRGGGALSIDAKLARPEPETIRFRAAA